MCAVCVSMFVSDRVHEVKAVYRYSRDTVVCCMLRCVLTYTGVFFFT